MIVTLTAVEQRLVRHLARLRYEHDRKVGAVATHYGEKDPLENEYHYLGAELAYCKLMNVYPDLADDNFGPFDALRHDGETVDVKQTCRGGGRMLVKYKVRTIIPHRYALMVGDFPKYYYAGELPSDEVLADANLDKTLPHQAYAVAQSQMRLK